MENGIRAKTIENASWSPICEGRRKLVPSVAAMLTTMSVRQLQFLIVLCI